MFELQHVEDAQTTHRWEGGELSPDGAATGPFELQNPRPAVGTEVQAEDIGVVRRNPLDAVEVFEERSRYLPGSGSVRRATTGTD
jgi:hypothetical protein